MDLKAFIKCLLKVTFDMMAPLLNIFFLLYLWGTLRPCYHRMALANTFGFALKVKNTSAWLRFLQKSSMWEFETTVFMILVHILNYMDEDCLRVDPVLYESINYHLFYSFFLFNMSYYIFVLLIFIMFGCVLLYSTIQGVQQPNLRLNRRGLTLTELNRIPEMNFEEIQSQRTTDNAGTCAICLNEFEMNDQVMVMPGCRHVFHSICIRQWLDLQRVCPFCRNNIRIYLRANPNNGNRLGELNVL